MIRRVSFAAMLVLALAAPALADDIVAYETEGEANAAAADPRADALDDAFARAVAAALAELVPADARAAHKADLDREIVGHARKWVTRFSVTRDETIDGRRQLAVSVRVDRDKLRARLGELAIALVAAPANVDPLPSGPATKTVAIVARVDAKEPPAALVAALRDAGMTVKAAHVGATQAIDDAAAAGDTTDVVAFAELELGAEVAVRGLAQTARLATARVRLVDRERKPIGSGTGTGSTPDRAIANAMADALPAPPHQLAPPDAFAGDDTPLGDAGIVLVRLPATTPWALVVAEQKDLAGARGVDHVELRRLSPKGWVLGVRTSASIDKLAEIAKHPPAAGTRVAVRIVGDVVELALTGTP